MMLDVDLEDLLRVVASELGSTPEGEALRAVLGGEDPAEALAVLERQIEASRSRLVRVRPGVHGNVVVWRPRQKTPAPTLRDALVPKRGPVQCANCGATVDSRAPGCGSCGMKFG